MTVKNDLIYRAGESFTARTKFEGCFDQGKDPRGFQRVHKVEMIKGQVTCFHTYLCMFLLFR